MDRRASSLDPTLREEARQRFDRGLTLFNAGDMAGAVAEFERTYTITRHPLVLYNLALVYAHLGQAAESLDACEQLRREGLHALNDAQQQRIRELYQEQRLRIGTLEVRTDVPGTVVQIDNVDSATTPTAPLRVTAGVHWVSLHAAGYEPRRIKVSVAGQTHEVVDVELVPLAESLAYLQVRTQVPDVEIRMGTAPVGSTPISSPLVLKPGTYDVELVRDGYIPVRRQVRLAPGAKVDLEVRMETDAQAIAHIGILRFEISEPEAVVTLDGEPRLDHAMGILLPSGRHALRVERAGFYPVVREVIVQPGTQVLAIELSPTPHHLAAYVRRNRTIRRASYAMLGTGSAFIVGGGAFLLWNIGAKRNAQRAFDRYAATYEGSTPGTCDRACELTGEHLIEDLDAAFARDAFGWASLGIGGAALLTGVLLHVLGDDPKRFDPEHDVLSGAPRTWDVRGTSLFIRF